MLLWIFSSPAVAPSLPSLTFHCGVNYGSHRFRDTWQDITEYLFIFCRGRPVPADFVCTWSQGYSSVFTISFLEPTPKIWVLRSIRFSRILEIFDFSPNLVSSVCTYGKSDLYYSIRNHSITFSCPVQAPAPCRTQPLWVWLFSGRAGLEVSMLLLGSGGLLAGWQCWLNLVGGLSHVGTFSQHHKNCAPGNPRLTESFLKAFQVRFPGRWIKGGKRNVREHFLDCVLFLPSSSWQILQNYFIKPFPEVRVFLHPGEAESSARAQLAFQTWLSTNRNI